MAIEACQAFLQTAFNSPELKQRMKAMTAPEEILQLGRRYNYLFDMSDLARASSCFDGEATALGDGLLRLSNAKTAFYHWEYRMEEIPGLKAVLDELPRLKVKPPSVDLTQFHEQFDEEDCRTTDMSPLDPRVRNVYDDVMKSNPRHTSGRRGALRREFHLINLDQHIDHVEYTDYLEAKVRTLCALEKLLGSEVRFSGSLWYPPASYRLWHTNETQPGWRMYIIDLDDDFIDPEETSFFRYMNPETKEIVTLRERRKIVRLFKVEQDANRLFWHCIVNPTSRHRWSFGFAVPESWMEVFPTRSDNDDGSPARYSVDD